MFKTERSRTIAVAIVVALIASAPGYFNRVSPPASPSSPAAATGQPAQAVPDAGYAIIPQPESFEQIQKRIDALNKEAEAARRKPTAKTTKYRAGCIVRETGQMLAGVVTVKPGQKPETVKKLELQDVYTHAGGTYDLDDMNCSYIVLN